MISLNIPTFQVNSITEMSDFYLFEGKVSFENGSPCPVCQVLSFKMHSYYERMIQDLPINGKRVELKVKTRKLQCQNEECTTKYFVQPLDFVRPSSLKTQRLEDIIIEISIPTSLIQATFILNRLGIKMSKSALSELLKQCPF
ncbi:transposase family protein [Lactococcus petauri]|uniref:Transposase IS204/IS1001/IS1096/IS1165 zinc-finger domain-containing protein n=1 Tax=Lactococcus petauri TaxID=1940789 RepID=A0A252CAB2_9LACT|nr:transposase family protein [Lactococcus petauri]OUK02764.1 hypothetical protein BZZ03_11250 [Lactococcus petauri]